MSDETKPVDTTQPHKVTDPETGKVTHYLGQARLNIGIGTQHGKPTPPKS